MICLRCGERVGSGVVCTYCRYDMGSVKLEKERAEKDDKEVILQEQDGNGNMEYCPDCGKRISRRARICVFCGREMSRSLLRVALNDIGILLVI